jgi:molecular chaperone GrpE
MIAQRNFLLFLLLSVLSTFSLAFSVSRPNTQTTRSVLVSPHSATCLRAVAEDEAPEEEKEQEEIKEEKKKAVKPYAATDILNSPDFLRRKLEVIKSDIAKAQEDLEEAKQRLEAGKAEWGSQIEDLQLEYQKIQQRMNTQSSMSDDMATTQVARQMLEVLDNFDRAFGSVTAETDEEKAIEAEYKKAYNDILVTFEKLGVEEIKSVGAEFDYEVHQAVMQKPSDEYEEGIVCEEFAKGFKIGDTLIRASMVAVAR